MLVRDVMTPNTVSAAPGMRLTTVAGRMRRAGVDCLPVRESGRLVGMISEHDIAYRAIANGFNPAKTTARNVMSNEVAWCYDDEAVDSAVHRMEESRARRLVVLRHDRRVAGILALGDAAREVSGEASTARMIEAFSDYYGWSKRD